MIFLAGGGAPSGGGHGIGGRARDNQNGPLGGGRFAGAPPRSEVAELHAERGERRLHLKVSGSRCFEDVD